MLKKLVFISVGFLFCCSFFSYSIAVDTKVKALMVIAKNDFRDEEYSQPRKLLEGKGVKVTVASSSLETAKGMLGMKVKPDILLRDVKVKDYAVVIFVGGIGSKDYWDNSVCHQIAKDVVAQKKVLGAICLAPGILAKAGVLKGRKATGYSTCKKILIEKGAIWQEDAVVVDGKIITANGPQSAEKFGKTILKVMKIK
ncbi:MAG: DJ-1/PfpI family protein [Candidatus Hydrogenedentota bacterium]